MFLGENSHLPAGPKDVGPTERPPTQQRSTSQVATQEVLARRRPSRIALGCSWISILHGPTAAAVPTESHQAQSDAMPLQNHKLHYSRCAQPGLGGP